MAIIMKQDLDPIYETMMLLYQGYDVEKQKASMICKITEMGGNGEEVYQKHLKLYDKYIQTFCRSKVMSDRDEFYFKDTLNEFFSSFIALFLIDRSLVDNISQMNNDQILELMFRHSEDIFELTLPEYSMEALEEFKKAENMIAFVNRFDLAEQEKWKMVMILQNPKDYYSQFTRLIKDNIQAFEKSVEAVRPFLEKQLEQFHKTFSDEAKTKKFLEDNNLVNLDIQEIIPTMATAPGIVMTLQKCYYGLLFEKISVEFALQSNGTAEYLMTCLKALSDHSKFAILTSLKASPKYATELAAELSLTSATVSHHMSTLLAAKIVYVEKENGKYYYHVDETTLNNVLELLRKSLL